MFRLRETPAAASRSRPGWSTTTAAASPASSRELAYLDAQGGRPQGFAGRPTDRNARASFVQP